VGKTVVRPPVHRGLNHPGLRIIIGKQIPKKYSSFEWESKKTLHGILRYANLLLALASTHSQEELRDSEGFHHFWPVQSSFTTTAF
jgi:hypothetical protein